jgi:hypothetical protein
MASLIVAGGVYTHGKIREKKEARREKKRKEYERRYSELEAEHKIVEEEYLARQKTGDSKLNEETPTTSNGQKDQTIGHDSPGSPEAVDGPEQWIEAALKKRQTSQSLS